MTVLEKGAPAAAIVAALSTLACCVPLGFLGAVGFASVGVRVQSLRPWLLGASVVLLCLGFAQLYLRKSACAKRSRTGLVLFWTAFAVAVLVILFPQAVASLIAG
jgi:hypothetical protein